MYVDRFQFRTELAKRDLKQKDLAKLTGISRVTIKGIANGRSCTIATGMKIAEALGLTVEDLLPESQRPAKKKKG